MGDFKQLLTLHDKTFVEHCVDNLLASSASEVIVVTGYRSEDVKSVLGDRPIRFADNPDYSSGMSSSVKRGFLEVGADSEGVLVALADQPLIEAGVFNLVIDLFGRMRPLVVLPVYDGRNGHPVVFDSSLRAEVLSMNPEEGLRSVVHSHASDVLRVDVSTSSVITDFDFPEDYRRIQSE
jgi:molybdenum cofactor cytidylyltransferase